ncbi:hypothetical protein GCM10010873_31670 [Cypionkella aquatica]|uniref:Uncharacterized protein n=1 Tax=Cypionkella aquatica TaxID=1756042 RepID=A0AA37TZQ3_9RHOB|nr:hypothetical protein [Cypionkella aquatica]GLS88193.1 hypothetical protein GCM10010873_31670 [Cypionkella aquatica]
MKITAGALSFDYDSGALRQISLDGVEIIRAIAYLVRDRDWGTLSPVISEEHIDSEYISFQARYANQGASLLVSMRIDFADGLTFTADARAIGAFETNRAGFTVLHPIIGVAGQPVTVEHCDGVVREAEFPLLIAPWQPFQNLRALTHGLGGWQVRCQMDGDTFEMEDQRQWGDASYKTYVRPLALPWPYRIAADSGFSQAVRLSWQAATRDSHAPPPALVTGDFPQTALVITAEEALRAALRPHDLNVVKPQRLLCHFDATQHGLAELQAFAALQTLYDAAYDLELIARCDGPLDLEFSCYAKDLSVSGLKVASIMVCPAVDRQSTPPGSPWPDCPPLEDIHRAARQAFPDVVLGGGMVSFFPELNRKRPPVALLDFVSHGLCPIVHDAGDGAVMQTLEAVPQITASARAIIDDTPYRLGPSTIAMRQNPYGARTTPNPDQGRVCMTDDDPRHRSDFGAAYAVGLAAALVGSGVQVWTPAGLYGPRGVMDVEGNPYPVAAVLRELAAQAGQAVTAALTPSKFARLSFQNTELRANLATYGPVTYG